MYGVISMPKQNTLIAHLGKNGAVQLLIDHLNGTAELAKRFAGKIGLPELGEIMGLSHDFGKASTEFQNYLRSAAGLNNPDEDDYRDFKAKKGKIDHSTAGAQLVYQTLIGLGQKNECLTLAQFLALAITSHHSGLIDCLTPSGEDNFSRRIQKPDNDTHLNEAKKQLSEIEQKIKSILTLDIARSFFERLKNMKEEHDSQATFSFKHGLLARFLLSCLLDADRINTADFEFVKHASLRNYGKCVSWDTLIQRLDARILELEKSTTQLPEDSHARKINQVRSQVAQACKDAAANSKGIYRLTVPTGGGKTLASLRFALNHAHRHNMDRIFYIAPYITIIDQNAETFRNVLEQEHERGQIVLEHHSNFVPEEDTRQRYSLLSENWDAPIVCTTQVQFLEALFGAGTRDARRMHQLANSVIILDEVQTIPIRIVQMLNAALRFLAHDCGSTIVLCTATQPPLDQLPDNPYRSLNIRPEQHIIKDEAALFQQLQRVKVDDKRKLGGLTNDEIVELAESALKMEGSVLIVVNTRAMAKSLYEEIKAKHLAQTYHLSTNMCPAHRLAVLNQIKVKLEAKEPVICVSTQLIEAGVDIDFGAVIRSMAGLDSIAQSAGRCNRHGLRERLGSVWIVNPKEEDLGQLTEIKLGYDTAQRILDETRFHSDRIGLEAIKQYYKYYYESRKGEMEYPISSSSSIERDDTLFRLLSTNDLSTEAYKAQHQKVPNLLLRQSFQSAAKEFRVIDSPTIGVITPYAEGKEIINDLRKASDLAQQTRLLRQAQRFSISLFTHQFDKLIEAGAIKEIQQGSGIYYLDEQFYSHEFGWSDNAVTGKH